MALAATILAVLTGPGARAASIVVVGDYPETNDGTLTSVTSLYGNYAKAVGFTIGGQPYNLASVTLRLAEQVGSNSTLSVELFGGTSSSPSGPALVGFNSATIPSVASNVTFTPTTALVLQAGAGFWLEVSGQSDTLNGIVWYASNPAVSRLVWHNLGRSSPISSAPVGARAIERHEHIPGARVEWYRDRLASRARWPDPGRLERRCGSDLCLLAAGDRVSTTIADPAPPRGTGMKAVDPRSCLDVGRQDRPRARRYKPAGGLGSGANAGR